MLRWGLAVVLVVGILLGGGRARGAGPAMLVVPLEGDRGVPKPLPGLLTGALLDAARKGDGTVLTLQDATKLLGFSPGRAIKACGTDALCLAQIGGSLEVASILVGTVTKGDGKGQYKVEVVVVDVPRSAIARRHALELAGNSQQVVEAFKVEAYGILGIRAEGRVTLAGAPAGAMVLLNGEPAGTTPWKDQAWAPGHYGIVVSAEGYAEWSGQLQVVPGETTILNVGMQRMGGAGEDVPEPELTDLGADLPLVALDGTSAPAPAPVAPAPAPAPAPVPAPVVAPTPPAPPPAPVAAPAPAPAPAVVATAPTQPSAPKSPPAPAAKTADSKPAKPAEPPAKKPGPAKPAPAKPAPKQEPPPKPRPPDPGTEETAIAMAKPEAEPAVVTVGEPTWAPTGIELGYLSAGAVGVLALAVAATAGSVGLYKEGQIADEHSMTQLDAKAEQDSVVGSKYLIANILYTVGGVALATGAGLFWWDHTHPEPGPGALSLSGGCTGDGCGAAATVVW